MSELDDKLNSILSNPQMMQQIMTLAQSLNSNGASASPQVSSSQNNTSFSPSMLNKISSIMQRGTIDKEQQTLLSALSPYLSRQKLQKLERAMHAAKMAGIASELLVSNRNSFPGR